MIPFTICLGSGLLFHIQRPELDSRGFPPFSRAKLCPQCLEVWAIIKKDESNEAFAIESQRCAGCPPQFFSEPIPGSLIEDRTTLDLDLDLIDYLPDELKQREFDLLVRTLELDDERYQQRTLPSPGSECPPGGPGGHGEDPQSGHPGGDRSGDFLRRPGERDGIPDSVLERYRQA